MRIKMRRTFCLFLLAAGAFFLLSGCSLTEGYEILKTEILQEEPESESFDGKETASVFEYDKAVDEESEEQMEPQETEADLPGEPEYGAYTDNYAYGTLDARTKQVYHEVLTAVLEQKEKVEVSTVDIEVLEQAYKAVCADYGGLFWVSGYVYTQYTRAGELIGMDFTPKYTMDYEQRQQLQQKIDASVDELLAGISISDSDYDKAKYVFEILVQNVDYDASIENNQNIISVFLSRATVCQGYACATQYLLRLLGIESVIVNGSANGESHAWNLVRLNGNYYYMDTTWGNSRYLDDSSQMEKYVNYNYLAVTSEEISRTHMLDSSFPLPECTSMEDNYFVRENRYFSEWKPEEIGALLAETWNAGGTEIAVKFSSPELYEQALNYFITEQHIADYCENILSVYYLEDAELYVLTFHFS